MSKRTLKYLVAWGITIVALYYAFRSADWRLLLSHLGSADFSLLGLAVALTSCSYLMRSRRWQFLFPDRCIDYVSAAKVLFLGFFMNNVFPARAGELLRAHFGSKVTQKTRTLVLATIASERLVDGLTLSLLFVSFALGIGGSKVSHELLYVAYLFLFVTAGVAVTLVARTYVYALLERLGKRFEYRFTEFALTRIQVFIDGLSPLFAWKRLLPVALWSIAIWSIELAAYVAIGESFQVEMPLRYYILFLVTLNFSSLVPAAPGGIGVIEAITSGVLVKVGVDREIALAMVISQHLIQYIVVGIPGSISMFTWKQEIQRVAAQKQ